MSDDLPAAQTVIQALDLASHPEGGFFREIYRSGAQGLDRGATSAIYYLLRAGDRSHWHRLDVDELWHHYAGAPLTLFISRDGQDVETRVLGPDLSADQEPVQIIESGWWQSAVSQGLWTLVGCQTAPAFEYAGWELAPPGWVPGRPLE